jgi:hypothetical protein
MAKLTLSVPGGVTRQRTVSVVAENGREFVRRASYAIKAFARQYGIAPRAVDYSIRYN